MKWYKQDPLRFEVEKRLLARHYPGAKLVIKGGAASIHLRIVTKKDTYHLEAVFGSRHPYSSMAVYVHRPRLKGNPPHRYPSKSLCLNGSRDVGPETTAKVYLDWAVQWINAYEQWRAGKPWPKTNRG